MLHSPFLLGSPPLLFCYNLRYLYTFCTSRSSQYGMTSAVGAASQWLSNERMMVYFKLTLVKCTLIMVKCSLMIVRCSSMTVKWVYDPTLISPSLTGILLALAWSTPPFAHQTIIEKLHWLVRLWHGCGVLMTWLQCANDMTAMCLSHNRCAYGMTEVCLWHDCGVHN